MLLVGTNWEIADAGGEAHGSRGGGGRRGARRMTLACTAVGCYWKHPHLRTGVSKPEAVFFPSFPAEGNNLSPEQIKSDLHEI